MSFSERKGVLGGLNQDQIRDLPEEVRKTRSEYIRDTAVEMDSLRRNRVVGHGVTGYRNDNDKADRWWTDEPERGIRYTSFDALIEEGWEFDEHKNYYEPRGTVDEF